MQAVPNHRPIPRVRARRTLQDDFNLIMKKVLMSWKFIAVVAWTISLWLIAKYVGFGSLYFTVSVLVFIYFNTSPREDGRLSPYSVFNRNFTTIQGTLEASQFEEQLGIRPNAGGPSRDEDEDVSRATEMSLAEAEKKGLTKRVRDSKKRNMLCECGSGRKFKKCCYLRQFWDNPPDSGSDLD
mmetsp:Transcript_1198/g.1260  ORF Transcript_1198/g.1260 Transcript_1198/m.1260 type:complete len:183 (+) Transcript_1198:113-661(+)